MYHALKNNIIDLDSEVLVHLVKEKVKREEHFHDFTNIDVISFLANKIENELAPTLKQSATNHFNLGEIIDSLVTLSYKIKQ